MKGTHHGTDRFILEWDQIMDFYNFPWTMPVPMRVTVFLRKDKEGVERIYRYQEEWWNNVQLNRETTFMPIGVLHENLRRFTGILLHKIVVNFVL
jgi:hypothetical protein